MSRRLLYLVLTGLLSVLYAQGDPEVVFGTTVTSTSGFQGHIYLIEEGSEDLPNFKRKKPVGTIYTTSLRVAPRNFRRGFPGMTDRYEWFAIDYKGRFWVETPGRYRFELLSDDGAKLYLNDKLVIDNDGLHSPMATEGSAELTRGVHNIRVSYFQGPGDTVALVLKVASPEGEDWRVFDMDDFRPPPDKTEWTAGAVRSVKRGSNY